MIPRTIYNEEHEMFRQSLVEYTNQHIVPNNPAWEQAKMMPREAWTGAGAMGFLAINVPEEYGSAGWTENDGLFLPGMTADFSLRVMLNKGATR